MFCEPLVVVLFRMEWAIKTCWCSLHCVLTAPSLTHSLHSLKAHLVVKLFMHLLHWLWLGLYTCYTYFFRALVALNHTCCTFKCFCRDHFEFLERLPVNFWVSISISSRDFGIHHNMAGRETPHQSRHMWPHIRRALLTTQFTCSSQSSLIGIGTSYWISFKFGSSCQLKDF